MGNDPTYARQDARERAELEALHIGVTPDAEPMRMGSTNNRLAGGVTLDPENPFERILIDMVETHRRKSADYAGTGEHVNPNQNFYDVAYQMSATAGASCESLIAVKQARLRVLLNELWTNPEFKPNNEAIDDTLMDRAVYAVIAVTIWNAGGYHKGVGKPA